MKKDLVKKNLIESNQRLNIYKKKINEAEKTFRQLNSLNMQGVLVQIEDCLDSNNIYAYKNWFDGVVWDGPTVKRHWVDITLKYDYEKMPDPNGAIRLVEQGMKVFYELSHEIVSKEIKDENDYNNITKKAIEEKKDIWLIYIKMPRHFIDGAIEDEPEELDASDEKNEENNDDTENLENSKDETDEL